MTSFFDADEDIEDYVDEINRCANVGDLDQAAWEDDWEDKLGKPSKAKRGWAQLGHWPTEAQIYAVGGRWLSVPRKKPYKVKGKPANKNKKAKGRSRTSPRRRKVQKKKKWQELLCIVQCYYCYISELIQEWIQACVSKIDHVPPHNC